MMRTRLERGHQRSRREFLQFLGQARGSLCEVETQIVIAHELEYITRKQEQRLSGKTDELGRILSGLIASIQRRKLRRAVLVPTP